MPEADLTPISTWRPLEVCNACGGLRAYCATQTRPSLLPSRRRILCTSTSSYPSHLSPVSWS
jgi:hypothetical protein